MSPRLRSRPPAGRQREFLRVSVCTHVQRRVVLVIFEFVALSDQTLRKVSTNTKGSGLSQFAIERTRLAFSSEFFMKSMHMSQTLNCRSWMHHRRLRQSESYFANGNGTKHLTSASSAVCLRLASTKTLSHSVCEVA